MNYTKANRRGYSCYAVKEGNTEKVIQAKPDFRTEITFELGVRKREEWFLREQFFKRIDFDGNMCTEKTFIDGVLVKSRTYSNPFA
jgi:hypothetical protein